MDDSANELTAAQQEVLETLSAIPAERPRFHPNLGRDMFGELNAELTALVPDDLDDPPLFVNKRKMAFVHGCRRRWLHEQLHDEFAWNPAIARGTVAHKAIELGVHWPGDPAPMDLVDEALGSFENGDNAIGVVGYLQGIGAAERAEVRSGAVEKVSSFFECFPPLKSAWRPVTEGSTVCLLAQERVKLSGKPDLTLGRAAGGVAGKVVIDLKTGGRRADHRADLRFYTLVDTLKHGTPPRLLVTYYLAEARPVIEPVTEAVLEAEMARVVDGVGLMVGLLGGGVEPDAVPSPGCRWCPLLDDCETGARHLSDEADRLGLDG